MCEGKMKKLFCSQYKNVNCCETCHNQDESYKTVYKGFEMNHCCSSYIAIQNDIDAHLEEPLEDSCRD